jgi:hypothetical protein
MSNICAANIIHEEFDEKKGVYIMELLIRKTCSTIFQKLIKYWFPRAGLQFSVEPTTGDTCDILTFEINLECAMSIIEIERCVEFGADQVKYPYVEYSDYINRLFKAAENRISYIS